MVFKPQTFYGQPPQEALNDPVQATLEARVAEALARTGQLDASQVAVTAIGDVITLTGSVGTPDEIAMATRIVQDVPGVVGVENLLASTGRDF